MTRAFSEKSGRRPNVLLPSVRQLDGQRRRERPDKVLGAGTSQAQGYNCRRSRRNPLFHRRDYPQHLRGQDLQ